MKTLIAALATTVFAAAVSAGDVYYGLADGNPDLFDQHRPIDAAVAIQRSVGDGFDRYQGWSDGNPDLFRRLPEGWTESEDPRFYDGFGGSPDISY